MATSRMSMVKRSRLKVPPKKPGYEKVLKEQQAEVKDVGEHFVRFQPDGSLTIVKEKKEIPQISDQEVQQRRLEKMEREIYQKAFEKGEKTGLELGQEKMEQEVHRLIPQLEGVLRELDNLPHRVFTASEHFFAETLLSFNRELLGHELTINPEGIADRVSRIMERSTGRKDIVIRVSPGCAAILERMDQFERITIQADKSVAPGSVVMESDFGGMEDNLEERLREVETAFRQTLMERLNESGLAEMAEAARLKAQQEKKAALTNLAEDCPVPEPVEAPVVPEPVAATPQPEPQPVAPQPEVPQPVAPQPEAPQPVAPQPDPQQADPQPAAPQPAAQPAPDPYMNGVANGEIPLESVSDDIMDRFAPQGSKSTQGGESSLMDDDEWSALSDSDLDQ
jgi:flagellar biosynthesis/type III secretory pathway protein FliH